MHENVRKAQEDLYRDLYNANKGTPMAVSSESLNHKKARFKEICEIFKEDEGATVHDVGMGIGDLYNYIQEHHPQLNIVYSGTEILEEFVLEARERFPDTEFFHRNLAEQAFADKYDYVVMSGVFHQRRETSIKEWEAFALELLRNSFEMCNKGIAFNFISPFVDFYQTQVYYANLSKIINFIIDDLSRFFVLKHNYALFEFTIFVYKEEYVKSISPEKEFQKYFKL